MSWITALLLPPLLLPRWSDAGRAGVEAPAPLLSRLDSTTDLEDGIWAAFGHCDARSRAS